MAKFYTFIIAYKRDSLTVKVDQKDGVWVYGYSLWYTPLNGGVADPGAGCAADGIDHRYNKKFSSRPAAILACLLYCRDYFSKPDFIQLMDEQIKMYRTLQPSLF